MVSSTRVFTTRNRRIRLLICANFIAVIRYSIALSDNIKSPDVQPWAKHQAPNPKLQRSPGIETPKTKLQTPKKSQVPSSKPRPALRASNLKLGASLVFGVWCLELGTWCLLGVWSLELFARALCFSKIETRLSHLKDLFELRQVPWAVAGDVSHVFQTDPAQFRIIKPRLDRHDMSGA